MNVEELKGKTHLSAKVTIIQHLTFDLLSGPGAATSEPDDSLLISSSAGVSLGGLKSVLKDTVSPAFGATIIIIITVIVSGSAYLCFLKYVCGGCCQPMQVAPTVDTEPNKVEEQV